MFFFFFEAGVSPFAKELNRTWQLETASLVLYFVLVSSYDAEEEERNPRGGREK